MDRHGNLTCLLNPRYSPKAFPRRPSGGTPGPSSTPTRTWTTWRTRGCCSQVAADFGVRTIVGVARLDAIPAPSAGLRRRLPAHRPVGPGPGGRARAVYARERAADPRGPGPGGGGGQVLVRPAVLRRDPLPASTTRPCGRSSRPSPNWAWWPSSTSPTPTASSRASTPTEARFGTKAEQYEPLEASLAAHPHLKVQGAHFGGDPRTSGTSAACSTRIRTTRIDSSATKWMARELGRQAAADSRAFIVERADRILFGTDLVVFRRRQAGRLRLTLLGPPLALGRRGRPPLSGARPVFADAAGAADHRPGAARRGAGEVVCGQRAAMVQPRMIED